MKREKIIDPYKNRGITLVEVLMVVSVAALFSSIIFVSISLARAKARDTQKKTQITQVKTALAMYNTDKGSMPKNYLNNDGSFNDEGNGGAIAFEDPLNPLSSKNKAYEASMKELVDNRYLPSIPHSPTPSMPYGYYDYGKGSTAGAVFAVRFETVPNTTIGPDSSCRPFASSRFTPSCTFPAGSFFDVPGGGNEICTYTLPDQRYYSCYFFVGCVNQDNGNTKCMEKQYNNGTHVIDYCASVIPNNWCSNNVPTSEYCSCNPY